MAPPRKKAAATAESDQQPTKQKTRDAKSQMGALLAGTIVQALNKTVGSRSLITGAEAKARKTFAIPTGIFQLDLALEGGWRVGAIHTLIGHMSAGKTMTLYRTIGEAQKLCADCWVRADKCKCKEGAREPVVAYLDVEGAFEAAWASRFFDVEKIMLSQPTHAEAALTIAEALLRSAQCDIVVIDSLAFLTPSKEIEEDISKALVGEQARLINRAARKFTAALNAVMSVEGRRPTIFFTNQIRMKVGVMFGNPETTPGGLAPGFLAWNEVTLRPAKYKMDDNGEEALYADFGFSVTKCKQGRARASYDFRMILQDTQTKTFSQLYDEDFILSMMERNGLLAGGGSSWRCLGEAFRKKTEVEDRLIADPVFREKATEALMRIRCEGASLSVFGIREATDEEIAAEEAEDADVAAA